MSVNTEDVKRVARLAQLNVEDSELEFYAENLTRILELVERMDEARTDDVEPLFHPQDMILRLREDRVTEEVDRDQYLDLAPESSDGMFVVPKVIE